MYIILLGAPGAGKGTQAETLVRELELPHVASGDLFREAAQQGSELGRRAKAYMDRGELVPDEVTIEMLVERIQRPDAQQGVVFDGYPRTLQQAEALDGALARRGGAVALALHVTASDDEIVRRLSGRWLCPGCGEIYNEQARPPKQAGVCDACGGALGQRDDDKPDVVRRRLELQRPSQDLLGHYRAQGKLIDIDGEQGMDAVTRGLLGAIEQARTKPGSGAASA